MTNARPPRWTDNASLWLDPPATGEVSSAESLADGPLSEIVRIALAKPGHLHDRLAATTEAAAGQIDFAELHYLAQQPSYPHRPEGRAPVCLDDARPMELIDDDLRAWHGEIGPNPVRIIVDRASSEAAGKLADAWGRLKDRVDIRRALEWAANRRIERHGFARGEVRLTRHDFD